MIVTFFLHAAFGNQPRLTWLAYPSIYLFIYLVFRANGREFRHHKILRKPDNNLAIYGYEVIMFYHFLIISFAKKTNIGQNVCACVGSSLLENESFLAYD